MKPDLLNAAGQPDMDFAVDSLNAPVVYAWCRGQEVLYVGSSKSLSRPLALRRHLRLKAAIPGDSILIWKQKSMNEALRLESALIRQEQPSHNGLASPTPLRFGPALLERVDQQLQRFRETTGARECSQAAFLRILIAEGLQIMENAE